MDLQKAPAKSKNTLLKFLPKPTSSVSFQNPPIYSPSKEKRTAEKPHKSNLGIGFSGPMVSMILADTRRRDHQIKNNSDHAPVYEPTSPRVSCMGQVKCKNYRRDQKLKSTDKVLRISSATPERTRTRSVDHEEASTTKNGKKKLGFKKLFGAATPSGGGGRKSGAGKKNSDAASLGTMKRFSSGRDKFSDIDWTKEVAAMDSGNRRYDSDDESDVVIPSSAPVIIRNSLGFDDNIVRVAGINTKAKNEINLWKRRTMQQPKPLQLHQKI